MRGFLLLFFLILIVCILSYKFSFALMSSSASNVSNSFAAASEFASSTPSATPTPTPPSVVINEIMWGGSVSSGSADEWIELRNTTGNAIDISGWTIDHLGSGDPGLVTISSGKTIPANGFFIISNNTKANSILNIDPNDIKSISLTNNPDSEQLVLRNGSLNIDTAGINGGNWFGGANRSPGPAKSMQRKDPAGDGTVSTNWKTATTQTNLDGGVTDLATPGAAN